MDADPTKPGVPSDRRPPAGDAADNVAICGGCQRPLTRTGPGGECLRCLLGFALSSDEEPVPASATRESAHPRPSPPAAPLRYGQFEVAVGFDGLPVELGAGAMGVTYRAHDTVLDSAVALKVIARNLAEHPAARARFLREARAAARLHHPNVASVSHYGEQDGECYYAMELVEGETLEARVRRDGPLPVAEALEVGVQVARALAAAEACGVIHRDLKPSNLMLTARQGNTGEADALMVKVIDWGLAKAVSVNSAVGADHTRGAFIGTPAFASPEQFTANGEAGRFVDARADIYSLGVTLWYLLCGRTPFGGRTLEEIYARQVNGSLPVEQIAAARLPARVVAMLKSMLAVDPADRPQSARELLVALRRCQEQFPAPVPPSVRRGRRLRQLVSALGLVAVLAGAAGAWEYFRAVRPSPAPADNSLAVLPFENLSPDKADAFFTTGVQDEITADLARIAALKVIGTNSTRTYPPTDRDLTRIGRELGVNHLLEGSVRREGGQVHVTIRLVDLLHPAQPWTEQYDRPVSEVFAVQGEITRAVADRLRIVLSEGQKIAINEPPTTDLAAYDLYLRAREIPRVMTRTQGGEIFKNGTRAIQLLDEAVARDPRFLLAHCELARRHDELYFFRSQCPPEELWVDHRSLAEGAIAKAARLRPDYGPLHLGLAIHALQVNRDPEQAEIEVQLARRSLPNNAQVESIAGRVARRRDQWDEALRCLERAVSLEPRDVELRSVLANTYRYLRRYEDFDRTMASIIALTPSGELGLLPVERAVGQVERSADLSAFRAALISQDAAPHVDDDAKLSNKLSLALWTRDQGAVTQVLADIKEVALNDSGIPFPKEWFVALAARMRGDQGAAVVAFAAARVQIEKKIHAQPYSGKALSVLAVIDAGLGRREEAIQEAQRACELAPFAKSNLEAPIVRCNLAVVYAWTGQNDLAINELSKLVDRPAGDFSINQPTYGDFRLNPLWDPLRQDPRFEALVQRLAPSRLK